MSFNGPKHGGFLRMRNLEAVFAIDQLISPNPAEIDYHDVSVYSSSGSDCHGFLHNAAMVLPSALFVLYLGFRAKKNIQKLTHDRAYIMIAYYLLLWFSSLLNLVWCSLQVTPLSLISTYFAVT